MLRAFCGAQQTPRDDISLRRFPSGSCGFYHPHPGKTTAEVLEQLIESAPMESFDKENAILLQRFVTKIDRRHPQLELAGLIRQGNSRKIRRHVAQHYIRLRAGQSFD